MTEDLSQTVHLLVGQSTITVEEVQIGRKRWDKISYNYFLVTKTWLKHALRRKFNVLVLRFISLNIKQLLYAKYLSNALNILTMAMAQ